MPLPVVAVLGATGHLGSYIANALLSPQFRHKFSSISILHNLARAPSEKVDHLREKGASIKLYLEGAAPPGTIHCPNLKKVLSNVDILINTYEFPIPTGFHLH